MPDHHHRAGGLRQSNKRNKRSKASKRSISRNDGGKVMSKVTCNATMNGMKSKADRKNMAQQKRDLKRQELMRKKRFGTSGQQKKMGFFDPPPTRLIGIISLSDNRNIEDGLLKYIIRGTEKVVRTFPCNSDTAISCHFESYKKDGRLTFLTSRSSFLPHDVDEDDSAVLAALDLARVCDMICFVLDADSPTEAGVIGNEIRLGDSKEEDRSITTGKTSHSARSCVQDWDHLISDRGDRILTALKGQGLPTPLTILVNTADQNDNDVVTMQSVKSARRFKIKRNLDLKKYVHRFATTEFGSQNDKVIEASIYSSFDDCDHDIENDSMGEPAEEKVEKNVEHSKLVRTLCTMSCSPAKWVALSPRCYLVTDSYEYDKQSKELKLTGYLRGMTPFDVNSLVHVPNVGTYACKYVKRAYHPLRGRPGTESMTESDEKIVISDPDLRESLTMYATPDALDGEQNLIGFDEHDTDEINATDDEKFARPAGWSDYQSAWLDAGGDNGTIGENEDYGELANELNKKSSKAIDASDGLTMDAMELDEANIINADERNALMQQRMKQQNEELDFPDEVQVNEDESAVERFARYRSLKSFRKSYWDPKENLPETYANIFHFSSFRQTQRSVTHDMKELIREADRVDNQFWGSSPSSSSDFREDIDMVDDHESDNANHDDDFLKGCIPSASYVTITLEDVPETSFETVSSKSLLTAVSLLEHENKVSVLHMGLHQSSKCDSSKDCPVKSKDVLTFRCGWRTWNARPVFSQNNLNCDKHKFERFLPTNGAFFAASVFGPITYTPCPVLVFRNNQVFPRKQQTKSELVAIGSVIGADADRIVVKRIILTGYPVRVHKRYATVKYMFYNPDDVKWFKPAGLYTKHGLQGTIIQSVGEHGTMKCLFNAPIKQHDTVCLPLYKRIYPKYATSEANREDADSLMVK